MILHPIKAEFAVNDNEKTSVINVRQVEDKWEDSLTMWSNQPTVNNENEATATIKTKDKNMPASIDLTDMVLNSIFKGKNNRYMIVNNDKQNEK